ncbi:MAG: hypothetical protein WBF43_04380 [Methylocella sp.]
MALMKAQGFDPAPLDILKASFNPALSRAPAGNGRESGESTSDDANITPIAHRGHREKGGHGRGGGFDMIHDLLELLRGRSQEKAESAVKPFGSLDAAHEKPINAERAIAALDISKGASNFPEQARLRALAVRIEIQPGWLAGAEVMKRLNSPYWNANYP